MINVERNNTSIIKFINDEISKSIYKNNDDKRKLKKHQHLIRLFFNNIKFNDTKGILLYHKMGTGKTILSISMAMDYEGDVIVFTNSSLINNYINDIKKYINILNETSDNKIDVNTYIPQKFTFISLNSFNLKTKIPDLKHKFVIIDEAHHVFSGVLNGSSNYLKLYYTIREQDVNDIRIVMLSGTPIVNDPFELVIALNMLVKDLIFPESYMEFGNMYLSVKDTNENLYKYRISKLENRIVGLVSFYELATDENFPTDLGIEIISCPMTTSQLNKYLNFKKIELEKSASFSFKGSPKNASISKPSKNNNYRISTRMTCNRDTEEDELQCVKYNKIYENILSNKGCALVYSQFVNKSGILGFAEFLKKKKYEQYNLNASELSNTSTINQRALTFKKDKNMIFNNSSNITIASSQDDSIKQSDNYRINNNNINTIKYFSIIEGDVSLEKRNHIQKIFNHENNKTGDVIHILLISSTGAEGLDLKFIRTVHILEPYWNKSRMDQIQSRAIRYKSHILLPPKERTVKTFVYLSSLNKELVPIDTKKDNLTTDEDIYLMAVKKQKTIDEFLHIIKRASIDCLYHYTNCIQCLPSNLPLFRKDFDIDINIHNPCNNKTKELELTHVKDDIYIDNKTNTYYKKINDKYIKI
jgi:hypothetical protein